MERTVQVLHVGVEAVGGVEVGAAAGMRQAGAAPGLRVGVDSGGRPARRLQERQLGQTASAARWRQPAQQKRQISSVKCTQISLQDNK